MHQNVQPLPEAAPHYLRLTLSATKIAMKIPFHLILGRGPAPSYWVTLFTSFGRGTYPYSMAPMAINLNVS